jgi:hypothetical protein
MKLSVTRVRNRLYDGVRRSQQIGTTASRIRTSIYNALAISILAALAPVASTAQSQKPIIPKQLNAAFFAALEAYQNTHSASALDQLQSALTVRRQLLSDAISSNPALVLASALPDDVKSHVPASLQAFVEQHVTLRGMAEVAVEDGPNYSRIDYGLKIAGQRLQLHFAGNVPSDWLTDTNVQVSGIQIGNAIALTARDALVLE